MPLPIKFPLSVKRDPSTDSPNVLEYVHQAQFFKTWEEIEFVLSRRCLLREKHWIYRITWLTKREHKIWPPWTRNPAFNFQKPSNPRNSNKASLSPNGACRYFNPHRIGEFEFSDHAQETPCVFRWMTEDIFKRLLKEHPQFVASQGTLAILCS